MEKSVRIWGKKRKRSPKEEVASPENSSDAAAPPISAAGKLEAVEYDRCDVSGGGKCADLVAAAEEVSGGGGLEVSSDYPPRNFKKYGSMAEVFLATSPLTIVNRSNSRLRVIKSQPSINELGKNMKKAKGNEEDENEVLFGNSIYKDDNNNIEDMEACPTRKPKFRSILELYEVRISRCKGLWSGKLCNIRNEDMESRLSGPEIEAALQLIRLISGGGDVEERGGGGGGGGGEESVGDTAETSASASVVSPMDKNLDDHGGAWKRKFRSVVDLYHATSPVMIKTSSKRRKKANK